MKKIVVLACMLIVSLSAFSQTIDQTKLDLSKAELAVAGPDEVYVTDILYDGEPLSVLLKYDGQNGAIIYGPWFAEDKVLPDNFNLRYATARRTGSDKITISDVIIGSAAYTLTATFNGSSEFILDRVWETTMPVTDEARIKALEGRINSSNALNQAQLTAADNNVAKLEADKAVYENEIKQLKSDLAAATAAAKAAGATTAQIVSKPSRIVASGFTGGRSVSGNWVVTSSKLSQTDNSNFFAKYMIPLGQTSSQTLYSIEAKADGTGFVGYGLHFFASGDRVGSGYGFGTSYLVWVTRDPDFYGSDATYLQLYKSYNDVDMLQSASIMIPYSINSTNTVELLYDRTGGKVTVSVNGTEYLTMNIPASEKISSGSKLALRALGKVTFTDLTVTTK